ncbi:unnamed protein product [Caenorhabditis sp. 36 PRJEB53466]|nr:unnamed protein product [Caenorhabditis sp. 36 PRJEB53466]
MSQQDTDDVFVMNLEGHPGDYYCMSCTTMCNYIRDVTCCEKTKKMTLVQKECRCEFMLVWVFVNAIRQIIDATYAGKKVVNNDGDCMHCLTMKKHNEEKWCVNQPKKVLLNRRVLEAELNAEDHVTRFVELRSDCRLLEIEKAQKKALKGLSKYLKNAQHTTHYINHAISKQKRQSAREIRQEEEKLEKENEVIKSKLMANVRKSISDAIEEAERRTAETTTSQGTTSLGTTKMQDPDELVEILTYGIEYFDLRD